MNIEEEIKNILDRYIEADPQFILMTMPMVDDLRQLITKEIKQARIDELNKLTTNMINDTRSNVDWYREPFECVHQLVEVRIKILNKD